MTSTSTFQGMDSETKPSSRVLAPPGGGSSNIFGSAAPAQPAPKKESAPAPKPVEPTPISQPNQGDRFVRAAPKQGEDSFQNLFGSEKALDYRNSPQSSQKLRSPKPVGHSDSSNQSSPSTFDSLFGDGDPDMRKKSASRKPCDSFNRLFGQDDALKNKNVNRVSDALKNKNVNWASDASKITNDSKSPDDSYKSLENLSLTKFDSPDSQSKRTRELDRSFHRVFGEFQADSPSARSKRHSDSNSAFNPITGQPYDLPEQKKNAAAKEDEEEEKGKENEKKPEPKPTTQTTAEAKEKTSTRIAQPPGGKSSGLW